MVLALDVALPGQRLADDGQADERRQRGQNPPPDGLGMDRRLDRRGDAVLARVADTPRSQVQRLDLMVQPDEISRAMTEADVLLVLDRRVGEYRLGEPRPAVEEVNGTGPGRELVLARFNPDDVQCEVRTVRLGQAGVRIVVRRGL